MSAAEDLLLFQIKATKLPEPAREVIFHPTRRWRFDFSYPEHKLGIEVDGGNRMAKIIKGRAVAIGRHTQDEDYRKLNEAALLGYRILRFTPAMVKSGEAVAMIESALRSGNEQMD